MLDFFKSALPHSIHGTIKTPLCLNIMNANQRPATAKADPGPAHRERVLLFEIFFWFVFVKFDFVTSI